MKGTVSGRELATFFGTEEGQADSKGEVEYWIGVKDTLVRKWKLLAEDQPAVSELTVTGHITATFSDFGKLVDIQEPDIVATESGVHVTR